MIGNANVAAGDADGADALAAGDIVDVGVDEGEGVGVGVGVGVGGGGMMFIQWCSGTVAPPISSTSFWQRTWSLSKSGGPKGVSAVPGKIKYVTLRSLTGRL